MKFIPLHANLFVCVGWHGKFAMIVKLGWFGEKNEEVNVIIQLGLSGQFLWTIACVLTMRL